ncbi:MAG: DUF364 domain-containing protein [Clostridiales bacterium]|jgi:uncharacterized protein (DUF4213/DUF364 family)|nr:DUF364 domain-containing protein [Clostridiales bacterium]
MWSVYDKLISGIPEDLTADLIAVGRTMAIVVNKMGAGLSDVFEWDTRPLTMKGSLIGAPLRSVAGLVKSWNFPEASIGLAAINSYYNSPEIAQNNGVVLSDLYSKEKLNDPFIALQEEVSGKKVASVGYFPNMADYIKDADELFVIEWEPSLPGQYPYTSCEYIIPECDYVFISSKSLMNKSLPRLLELSKGARKTILAGPATPLAPCLLETSICNLSGFVITDSRLAHWIVSGADSTRIFRSGQKVSLKRNEAGICF